MDANETAKLVEWASENAVELIGHALTFLGIILAAVTVVWQLGRQHRSSLLLQRESAREGLKLRLHETLMERVRKACDATGKARLYVLMIPGKLENYQQESAKGHRPSPLEERATEFLRLDREAADAVIDILEEFESWSIAFPGLEVFQTAIHAAQHDVREAFMPLFRVLSLVLPGEAPILST